MEESKKQLAELSNLKQAYCDTFGTPAGKKVMADLENLCFIDRTTFDLNPGAFARNEGMRLVVVHLKNMINMDLEELTKLINERNENE